MTRTDNLEEIVIDTFYQMYSEIGWPLSATNVAKRVGCSRATALRHLGSNQERLSSHVGRDGERFFKPKGDE